MTGISILEVFRRRLPADSALRGKIENYLAHPESYPVTRDLGLEMVRHTPLVVAAEPFLARALARTTVDADRTNLLAALGVTFTFRAHHDGAIQVYGGLARSDPHYRPELGDALFEAGRFADAAKIYAEIIDGNYGIARARADAHGGPITQLLSPARTVCIRYGEMANKLDFYSKARALGLVPPVHAILAAPPDLVVNRSFLDYWRDQGRSSFTVLSDSKDIADAVATHSGAAHHLDYVRLPSGRVEHRQLAYSAIQKMWDDQRRPPLLALAPEHRARGRAALKRLGVPENAWFAALHIREASSHGENVPWNPNALRGADISTYGPAIEAIVARGGYVIRMGDPSLTRLAPMKNVVDYAHLDEADRADWLDVFCCAASRFFLGSVSGPPYVGWVFGVPMIGTNWFPTGYWPFSSRDIFIPKLLRRRDGSFLNIRDAVRPPIAGTAFPGFYTARGLEVVDNRPEDIAAAATEMMDRLDGRLVYDEDDDRLQQRFREKARFDSLVINARIGRDFLRNHRFLIGT